MVIRCLKAEEKSHLQVQILS